MISLQAKTRTDNNITKDEMMAVAYGPKFKSTPITLNYAEFVKVYNQAGETGVITLSIDGKSTNVLVHDIVLHPVRNTVQHVDFYVPEAGKKVNANIPLVFIGESEAVKAGNILVKVLHEIEVEALPENLPHDIQVDISKIVTLQDDITVADLTVPANVTLLSDKEEIVASVVAPEEEQEAAPVDLGAIEVAQKGKKEEEATA